MRSIHTRGACGGAATRRAGDGHGARARRGRGAPVANDASADGARANDTRANDARANDASADGARANDTRANDARAIDARVDGARAEGANGGARGGLYDEVTRRILFELEEGRVPWAQPWGEGGGAGVGLPRNARTGRAYSGINILLLWGAVIDGHHRSQRWLTFRQAQQAGGSVRKGARGTTIFYADRFMPKGAATGGQSAPAGVPEASGTSDSARGIAFLKRFTVFNLAQIDGLPEGLASDPALRPAREIVPVAEALIAASGVAFRVGGDRAFYAPSLDVVQVPPQPAFFDQINYYRTALHELTHATGHRARLDRPLTGAFGSKEYAREELVAEMGSAFLCAALGIVPTVRHADYLAGWLDLLRCDSKAIFRAASAASKAADWLLARVDAPIAPVVAEREA